MEVDLVPRVNRIRRSWRDRGFPVFSLECVLVVLIGVGTFYGDKRELRALMSSQGLRFLNPSRFEENLSHNNEISMARMPVEDDLIERIACNRFWSTSKRKLQGIISVTIIVAIIVGFSVIKHKRVISSQYDNER